MSIGVLLRLTIPAASKNCDGGAHTVSGTLTTTSTVVSNVRVTIYGGKLLNHGWPSASLLFHTSYPKMASIPPQLLVPDDVTDVVRGLSRNTSMVG